MCYYCISVSVYPYANMIPNLMYFYAPRSRSPITCPDA